MQAIYGTVSNQVVKDEIMTVKKIFAVVLITLVLAGCGAKATVVINEGDLLLQETFDDIDRSTFPSYGLGEEIDAANCSRLARYQSMT